MVSTSLGILIGVEGVEILGEGKLGEIVGADDGVSLGTLNEALIGLGVGA